MTTPLPAEGTPRGGRHDPTRRAEGRLGRAVAATTRIGDEYAEHIAGEPLPTVSVGGDRGRAPRGSVPAEHGDNPVAHATVTGTGNSRARTSDRGSHAQDRGGYSQLGMSATEENAVLINNAQEGQTTNRTKLEQFWSTVREIFRVTERARGRRNAAIYGLAALAICCGTFILYTSITHGDEAAVEEAKPEPGANVEVHNDTNSYYCHEAVVDSDGKTVSIDLMDPDKFEKIYKDTVDHREGVSSILESLPSPSADRANIFDGIDSLRLFYDGSVIHEFHVVGPDHKVIRECSTNDTEETDNDTEEQIRNAFGQWIRSVADNNGVDFSVIGEIDLSPANPNGNLGFAMPTKDNNEGVLILKVTRVVHNEDGSFTVFTDRGSSYTITGVAL